MQKNKMGILPIGRLVITMSLPIMISMLVQALYNVVDSMFVAQIGEKALTAVSLAFPIQNLMIAFATGTGVGINAIVARHLGAKEQEDANKSASIGLMLLILTSLMFVIIGFTCSHYFFQVQSKDPEIVELGTKYMQIVTIGSLGIFMEIAFERILQATGRTIQTMIMQCCGALTNIILDPILIFGLFGMPKLGVAGAAFATIIGQFVAASLGLLFNHKYNHDLTISIDRMKLKFKYVRAIYGIGIPSIIMASISSLMTFLFNQILAKFSATAIAFFGVYMKLQSFIFMPVFGLNNGLVPIISYNYGAKLQPRIMKTIKTGLLFGQGILLIGFILFTFFPKQLLMIFNPSPEMLKIGVIGLKIIALHFLIAGINIVLSSVFQALGHGVISMILSIVRQLIVLLPVAYLLSFTNNINLIWFCCPIAEVVTIVLSLYFYRKIYNQDLANLA